MNDVTYVEAARRLAERMMTEGGTTPEDRIGYGYLLATAHRPRFGGGDDFGERLPSSIWIATKWTEGAAVELVTLGERRRDETLDVAELAAYTMVANLILNFDGTITKE